MQEARCKICGERIDKSACGQQFTIITIKDDSENDPEKYRVERFYLCDNHTSDLRIWFLSRGEV